ncbi:hypothetical protein BO221_49410 [Archangium sp. Cb G35]|uniref:DUF2381 family protein n=1 Tax=Archangium sp. Cb G35 TaxID=1920190 RepID=UPI000964C9F5|nr:DUF2381 family protein [Archangium sp. Cb G35]OJT16642.1 hypothetical protein BO221_49410 [Archangium sp. Cb G35]
MLPPFPGALLALALLTGTAEAAEPPGVSECSATSRLALTAESTEQTPGVCVTPDEPTTFVFGAPLPPGAVVLSDNRSISFAQVDNFVTVYPKRSLLAGERVKLTVRFADGSAPESASFWLVGHSVLGARRVEVFRHSRPADELKREASEARAEARQCQEDKARLLAERTEPGGLMGAAWLERTRAVQSKNILGDLRQYPGNALELAKARSYSHPGSVAVRLKLLNPGAEPWTAAGAVLKDSTGAEVEFSPWQEAAIPAGAPGFVVVGAEREAGQLACPCTLKLWEAEGPRTVTLGNVTFPPVEQGGERE